MGLAVFPPSINRSRYSFYGEEGGIRFGLGAIKGLGGPAIREIVSERKKKPFGDLFDFCIRLSKKTANRKTLESLIHSGSFDEFGKDRATLLSSLDIAIEHAQLMRPEDDGQAALFTADDLMPKPKYMEVDSLSLEHKLAYEKEVLGFYLSSHPLSIHEKIIHERGAIPIAEITSGPGQQAVGAYITGVKKIRTKKGDPMAFLTISDSSGEMEAIAFPEIYKRYSGLFSQGAMAIFEGKVESRDEKNQFIIRKAEQIDDWIKGRHKERLYLKLLHENQEPECLAKLETLLSASRGKTEVVLHYEGVNKTIRLGEEYGVKSSEFLLSQLSSLLGKNNVVLK